MFICSFMVIIVIIIFTFSLKDLVVLGHIAMMLIKQGILVITSLSQVVYMTVHMAYRIQLFVIDLLSFCLFLLL